MKSPAPGVKWKEDRDNQGWHEREITFIAECHSIALLSLKELGRSRKDINCFTSLIHFLLVFEYVHDFIFKELFLISVANSCFKALGGNFRPFFPLIHFACLVSHQVSSLNRWLLKFFLLLFLICGAISFFVLEPFVYGLSSQLREIQKFFSKQLRLCINLLENICWCFANHFIL